MDLPEPFGPTTAILAPMVNFSLIWDSTILSLRIYKMADMILGAIKKNIVVMENLHQKMIRRIQKVKWINSVSALLLQFCSYLYVGLRAIYGQISIGSTLRYISAYQKLSQSVGCIFNMFIQLVVKSKYLVYFYNYLEIPNKRYVGTLPIEKQSYPPFCKSGYFCRGNSRRQNF